MTVEELQKILDENPEVTDIEFNLFYPQLRTDGTSIYLREYASDNYEVVGNFLNIW